LALSTIGTLETYNSREVEVVGDYAYLANFDFGLRVIDISDPTLPVKVGAGARYFDAAALPTAIDRGEGERHPWGTSAAG
jgi:hypothetical protein